MATWDGVKNYIGANYPVQGDTDGSILTLVLSLPAGRSQLIQVMHLGPALDWVRFFSPFGRVDQIRPQQLAAIRNSVFGVVALGGLYGLVHLAFMPDLDASEIDTPLVFLTAKADEIENELGLGDEL